METIQSIAVKLGLAAALALALFVGGCQYGKSQQVIQQKDQVIEQVQEVKKVEDTGQAAANTAETKVQEKIVYVQQAAKVIEKKVYVYVQSNPDSNTRLDPEWLRLHNAAAKGCDASSSTCVPDESVAQGTTAGAAITAVTNNYAQYQQCREIVEGWQQFYTDLKAKYDAAAEKQNDQLR